ETKGAKRSIRLEVSGGFHSILMHEASIRLAKELTQVKISEAKIPVISNVDARPTNLADEIREKLAKQVESSVLWEDSVRFMIKEGVSKFFEIGPGKILKGLIRKIDPNVEVITIEKIEDLDNL
ncbi:MAG: ACP S-malonyltransferase, partial [Candidatus Omnitrophota bacterium]